MRCPTLSELPPPPCGKVGWPWTEESSQLPDTMSNGSSWPRISIVTSSYNQGQFIEETIRSILLQGYPNLEYIIIDGASTDSSVEIIRKYEPWLAYWESKPDKGQAHAINKGFALATGDLLNWINSDDLLLAEALGHVATAYQRHPNSILLGDIVTFLSGSNDFFQVWYQRNVTLESMVKVWQQGVTWVWGQQGTFVPRFLYKKIGDLDETLRYVFDRDWMCCLLQHASVNYLHKLVAKFRYHYASKTVEEVNKWLPEQATVTWRYYSQVKGLNQSFTAAALKVWQAQIYLGLGLNYWDRKKGVILLGQAVQQDWRAVMLPTFINLCFRALMPLNLLHAIRTAYHRALSYTLLRGNKDP